MSDEMRLNILSSNEYSIYEGLANIPKIIPGTKSIWLINTNAVIDLINLFGSPVDDLNDIDI